MSEFTLRHDPTLPGSMYLSESEQQAIAAIVYGFKRMQDAGFTEYLISGSFELIATVALDGLRTLYHPGMPDENADAPDPREEIAAKAAYEHDETSIDEWDGLPLAEQLYWRSIGRAVLAALPGEPKQ